LNEDYNFFWRHELKRPLVRPSYRMEDNVETGHQDAREEGLGGLDSSGLRWGHGGIL